MLGDIQIALGGDLQTDHGVAQKKQHKGDGETNVAPLRKARGEQIGDEIGVIRD